jgi:hypothetical protein
MAEVKQQLLVWMFTGQVGECIFGLSIISYFGPEFQQENQLWADCPLRSDGMFIVQFWTYNIISIYHVLDPTLDFCIRVQQSLPFTVVKLHKSRKSHQSLSMLSQASLKGLGWPGA